MSFHRKNKKKNKLDLDVWFHGDYGYNFVNDATLTKDNKLVFDEFEFTPKDTLSMLFIGVRNEEWHWSQNAELEIINLAGIVTPLGANGSKPNEGGIIRFPPTFIESQIKPARIDNHMVFNDAEAFKNVIECYP